MQIIIIIIIIVSDFPTRKYGLQLLIDLAAVVRRLDNAIRRINRYPVDKC